MQNENLGWHNRGYLQHLDVENAWQFITYRLADSIPKDVMLRIIEENQNKSIDEIALFEKYLDKGYGSCLLENKNCADIVLTGWNYFNKERYDLIAWVIMPNHVHVLIRVYEGFLLPKIIHSWKSYTAKEMNKISNHKGAVWQKDYWDRYIRSENQLLKAIHYIEENPVKAGLIDDAENWYWNHINRRVTNFP